MATNRKLPRIIALIIILALAGGGYLVINRHGQTTPTELQLYGNVDIRQIQLAFQESGRVEKILVQEGDTVKKGELLAEIDPVRYQANLDRARAELAAQEQVVKQLKAGSRPQEIAKAQADVRAEEAKLRDSALTLNRLQQVVKKNAVSKQQVDDATAAHSAATEGLEAARQALNLVLAGPRQEEIAAAQAKLLALQAGVDLAAKELSDTKLLAPTDAVVRDRIMEPGDMAFPATPILTLAQTNPLWIRGYVAERDLGKIWLGMKTSISTDSFPNKRYEGWLGYISPTAEFTPKTVETQTLRTRLVYQARIFICNPQNELRLGMPATVHIDLRQPHNKTKVDLTKICPLGSN